MESYDTYAYTHNLAMMKFVLENIKTVLTALLVFSFFCLNQFLKQLNLSKGMNIFYLRYYIRMTIGETIGNFS